MQNKLKLNISNSFDEADIKKFAQLCKYVNETPPLQRMMKTKELNRMFFAMQERECRRSERKLTIVKSSI